MKALAPPPLRPVSPQGPAREQGRTGPRGHPPRMTSERAGGPPEPDDVREGSADEELSGASSSATGEDDAPAVRLERLEVTRIPAETSAGSTAPSTTTQSAPRPSRAATPLGPCHSRDPVPAPLGCHRGLVVHPCRRLGGHERVARSCVSGCDWRPRDDHGVLLRAERQRPLKSASEGLLLPGKRAWNERESSSRWPAREQHGLAFLFRIHSAFGVRRRPQTSIRVNPR